MSEKRLADNVREMMVTGGQIRDLLDDMLAMAKDVDAKLAGELRQKGADDDIYEASRASYLIISTLLSLSGKVEELTLAIDTLLWPCVKDK